MTGAESLSCHSAAGPALYLNKDSGTALDLAGARRGDACTMDVRPPRADLGKLATSKANATSSARRTRR